MPPDPKTGGRIVDRGVYGEARIRWDSCAACGGPPGSVHHIVQRGSPFFGDDVIANVCLLCGSGTTGCHGAWHGTPYIHYNFATGLGGHSMTPQRRDADWVAGRLGVKIVATRADTLAYLVEKLGKDPAQEFLLRSYRTVVTL